MGGSSKPEGNTYKGSVGVEKGPRLQRTRKTKSWKRAKGLKVIPRRGPRVRMGSLFPPWRGPRSCVAVSEWQWAIAVEDKKKNTVIHHWAVSRLANRGRALAR